MAEGVIKFTYSLARPEESLAGEPVAALLAWRSVLRRLDLIGQRPDRYGGFGYGNVSRRSVREPGSFIVTGSQTAGVEDAGRAELVCVRRCDLRQARVQAEGVVPPSSESLTHAMIYACDAEVNWVFHGHSPHIWTQARPAGLPAVGAHVGYGSPQMAEAVAALLRDHRDRPLAFVTMGHRDGVFACGASAGETGARMVDTLANCLALGRPAGDR